MKLTVFYRGLLVTTIEPNSNHTYMVGRAKENNIVIMNIMMSREFGKIYHDNGNWYFENQKTQVKYLISQEDHLRTPEGLEFFWEDQLHDSPTGVIDLHRLANPQAKSRFHSGPLLSVGLSLFILGVAAAVYFGYLRNLPMDSGQILKFARAKVVEFELERSIDVENQVKTYGKLEDKDFVDSIGYCTGFIVAPKVVLTAHHCFHFSSDLNMTEKFQIKTSDGKQHKASRILGFDSNKDFLFLEVPTLAQYEFLEFAETYHVGQKVFTLGNVGGEGIAIRDGIIAGETWDPNHPKIKFLRYSAAASPGNSGGPLVDEQGKIIALVFAKNQSENYNLGTDVLELREGFKKFVLDQTPKKVLNIGGGVDYYRGVTDQRVALIYGLGYPIPLSVDEYPEVGEELAKFEYEVEVPAEVTKFISETVRGIDSLVQEKFKKVYDILSSKDVPGEIWETRVNKKLPIFVSIYPTRKDLNFVLTESGVLAPEVSYLKVSGNYDTFKMALNEFQKSGSYLYGSLDIPMAKIKNNIDFAKIPKGYTYYSSKIDTEDKNRIGYQYDVYDFFMKTDGEIVDEKTEVVSDDTYKHITLGNQGLLIDTKVFPFIRPISHKSFTMSEFIWPINDMSVIKDEMNREWRVRTWDLFDSRVVYNYCNNGPTGTICISRFANKQRASRAIEATNFERYMLSDMVLEDQYYTFEHLTNVLKSDKFKSYRMFSDLEMVSNVKGKLSAKLKTLGFEFEVSKKDQTLELLRPLAAVFYDKDQSKDQTRWINYGIETIYQKKTKTGIERELCTMGIDLKRQSFIPLFDQNLSSLREVSSVGEIPRGSLPAKKENPWKQEVKTSWNDELGIVFGYCVPLLKDESGDKFRLRFDQMKQHRVSYHSDVKKISP
ncbi:MAG: trypsin-like peptidase domain-containing protein [Pseudomonadota bacterium]|nr:trypsin-like peptidase domain-containing protein [Pseudomonadota bacterium]